MAVMTGSSSNDAGYNLARDIRQAEITTIVTIGKFGVIKAKQGENGRVQIMDVNRFIDCRCTKLVGGPINSATLDPATSQPGAEALVIIIAAGNFIAVAVFGRFAAKFTAPDD